MPNKPEQSCTKEGSASLPRIDLFGWAKRRREISRARHIGVVLVRYGFGELAARFGLESRVFFGRRTREDVATLSEPERMVKALEELGPTFVKLGQLLSTRPDILPPEYIKAMEKLQDKVPGITSEEVEAVITTETCKQLTDIFADFERKPLAAASLAQVHRAVLRTGETVAVKVQRPKIEPAIEGDLSILATIARFVERRQPDLAVHDPVGLVNELGRSIRLELDFVHEGQNCDICRKNFAEEPRVVIPKVYWDFTTRRVLVLEMLEGTKVTDRQELESQCVDRTELAREGANIYMKMVFEHGFFQPDPHPGNLVVLPGGRIGVIDFGMFSRIGDDTRDLLVDLLLAAYRQQSQRLTRMLLAIGTRPAVVDESALEADVQDLLDRYYGVNLGSLSMGRVMRELLVVSKRYRISMPAGLSMLMRGIATVEGLGVVIDPEFNFVEEMRPFLERLALRRFGPLGWYKDLRRTALDLESLARDLPSNLRQASDWLKRGEVKLKLDHEELQQVVKNVVRTNNQLAAAVVLAAIIIGASLLVVAAPTSLRQLVPVFGFVAFIGAAAIGIYLLFQGLRRG